MSTTVSLSKALRREYQELFDSCEIRPARQASVESIVNRMQQNVQRYQGVAERTKTPWFVVAVTHAMESSLNFRSHLHNGDPLSARTVQVPAGRPRSGTPPFTWEASAEDALAMKRLHLWKDWSVPGMLYVLERYNGMGYRSRGVLTPYLWSFSQHYTAGKFVKDGVYSASAVSEQCGCAVMLRRMAERGLIAFDVAGVPEFRFRTAAEVAEEAAAALPLLAWAPEEYNPVVEGLQRGLNRLPGIFLRVDGFAGDRTSDAFRRVTGVWLPGDPRAARSVAVGRGR
jgi:lysozyme family protein